MVSLDTKFPVYEKLKLSRLATKAVPYILEGPVGLIVIVGLVSSEL